MPFIYRFFMFAMLVASLIPLSTYASVADWQKGISMNPKSSTDFGSASFQQSLQRAAQDHVNMVTLIIPLYQSSRYSTDIQRGWNTPTDASLTAGIQQAGALGIQVTLKPHVDLYDGSWRAHINPGDRNGWFTAYRSQLEHFAQIGQQYGVSEIVIGTELISMSADNINSTNTQNWNALIAALRGIYSGKLTYSANWGGPGFTDEKNHIQFWPQLDHIGIAAYFNLTNDWNNNVDFLKNAWNGWRSSDIQPLSNRFQKPVLFSEIGYRSIGGAHTDPWNYWRDSYFDENEQANDYEALFSYWNSQPFMQGVSLWEWNTDPNAGGQGDKSYTPQNKKAETVMSNWFGNSPSGGPPPPQPGTFQSAGSHTPANPGVGQTIALNASVTSSATAQNTIVDLEVYGGGTRVFQKFFESQNFVAGQTLTYNAAWVPLKAGTYTVKIGVFSASWMQNYAWNDGADSIIVGSASPPPPPPPSPDSSQIDVWWPTNGSTVSGVQPFKAMLTNQPLSDYVMYWQVDGDRLNLMSDSSQDYPHKEVLADVSGWTWKGAGPYVITFIAKDRSGNVIAKTTVTINAAR